MGYLNNANVVVTGGAGFIGSNLCDKLIELGAKVSCLDNLSTGHIKNIEHLLSKKNFSFTKIDIKDYTDCYNSIDKNSFIIHLAARGSVPKSILDPISTTNTNINGTLNVLHAASKRNVKKFVYASSSSVYGDSTQAVKQEEVIGTPLNPYAISKRVNELHSENYTKLFGLDTIGLRFFNVFGPRQDPMGDYAAVIPKFIFAALKDKEITIYGDGEQTRDFTHIDNITHGIIQALTIDTKEVDSKIFNLGCSSRISINDLASSILELLQKNKNGISYYDARVGDIKYSRADISKAKKYLNYEIVTTFEKGLIETIEYFKKYIS